MNDKPLAIIPARGGSRRIPRKNIRSFLGKPIIAYSVEAALKSNLFCEVMVSTEDKEIAKIAKEYGATVPFFRSNETADDFATIENVLEEVLLNYSDIHFEFESFCCILPTSPLLSAQRLTESFKLFNSSSFDSLFPVLRFSYPIQRALKVEMGKVVMAQPQYIHSRSQDLEPMYHDAGQFYWMKTSVFMLAKELFCQNAGMIELSEMEIQDIDTIEDWKLAEYKYRILNYEY
jgi:pseudaminic acid cytidylyltransferase